MAEAEPAIPGSRDIHVDACERWWRLTDNPLYVWEAVACCLNASPPAPIPGWCLPKLAEAATKLTDLAWSVAHDREHGDVACKKVAERLGLVRQGKKNAFDAMAEDGRTTRAAVDQFFYAPGEEGRLVKRRTGRHLSP
jgi:hypothetical protein